VTVLLDISLGLLVIFLVMRLLVSGMGLETAHMSSVNKFIELFPAMALAFWVMSVLAAREIRFERTAIRIPVLLFMVVAVLSIARASYPFSAAQTAGTWVTHICVFFLVVNLGSFRRRYRVIIATIAATAIVVALLAFHERWFGQPRNQYIYEQYPEIAMRDVEADLRGNWITRLYSGEVQGPFVLSNTYAGYLIIVLPMLLFLAYGAFRDRRQGGLALLIFVTGCIAAAWALYMTGSKGGWLALLGGAVLFAGMYWLYRQPPERRRKARIKAIIMVAAFVVLAVAAMAAVGYEDLPASAKVRLGYWDSAVRMIYHNPLGVGISNFQEEYTKYQQPWATEVKNTHNSYLSIWAELSALGLGAFLAILLISGRRYLAALKQCEGGCAEETPSHSEDGGGKSGERQVYLAMLLAGLAGFVFVTLLERLSGPRFDPEVTGCAAAVWTVVAAGMLFLRNGIPPTRFVSLGIGAGLLAFACHAFIDFDFYSHGINATFWALLGLLMVQCCRLEARDVASSRLAPLGVAGAILIIGIVVVFGAVYVPHALYADWCGSVAERLKFDAVGANCDLDFMRGAAEEYEKASELNYWNAENYLQAAEIYHYLYNRTRKPEYARKADDNYSLALILRRESHHAYFSRGVLRINSGVRDIVASGVADIEKAVELYPVCANYHYHFGLGLRELSKMSTPEEADRLWERANREFLEALRFHDTVVYPRGKLNSGQLKSLGR
jgi:hypothetical protein